MKRRSNWRKCTLCSGECCWQGSTESTGSPPSMSSAGASNPCNQPWRHLIKCPYALSSAGLGRPLQTSTTGCACNFDGHQGQLQTVRCVQQTARNQTKDPSQPSQLCTHALRQNAAGDQRPCCSTPNGIKTFQGSTTCNCGGSRNVSTLVGLQLRLSRWRFPDSPFTPFPPTCPTFLLPLIRGAMTSHAHNCHVYTHTRQASPYDTHKRSNGHKHAQTRDWIPKHPQTSRLG